ncbi:MAG TPA: alpha/beta hydrolase [Thermoanaerobaculia bacterium]
MTTKRVIYQIPGMEAVTVRRDVKYRATDAGSLTLDVYYPPDTKGDARTPAVIFVVGYSDLGAQRIMGCRFKEMEGFISWAQLTAASGMVAITYSTGADPAEDARALLRYVRQNAAALGIDETRIGIWACSGHVPNALAVLMDEESKDLKCAALCYGLTLDLDGFTGVADAAATLRFVTPAAGKSVDDLPKDVPLFIMRSGRDEFPHLNETMDRFLARAVGANLPVTFVNQPGAPHAFDLLDDSETSRETIRRILGFLRFHLG